MHLNLDAMGVVDIALAKVSYMWSVRGFCGLDKILLSVKKKKINKKNKKNKIIRNDYICYRTIRKKKK